MLFHTTIPSTESYTALMVSSPIRLACLSFAGLARGVYYVEGDLRPKLTKPHDRRLMQAGLVSLRYVGPDEKPVEYVRPEEAIAATIVEPEPVLPDTETVIDDAAPIVVIEDKPKRRGRAKKSTSVAQEAAEVKLGYHDEDIQDAEPSTPAAAEACSAPEGSPATVA